VDVGVGVEDFDVDEALDFRSRTSKSSTQGGSSAEAAVRPGSSSVSARHSPERPSLRLSSIANE
jgi:hypothetical protein